MSQILLVVLYEIPEANIISLILMMSTEGSPDPFSLNLGRNISNMMSLISTTIYRVSEESLTLGNQERARFNFAFQPQRLFPGLCQFAREIDFLTSVVCELLAPIISNPV